MPLRIELLLDVAHQVASPDPLAPQTSHELFEFASRRRFDGQPPPQGRRAPFCADRRSSPHRFRRTLDEEQARVGGRQPGRSRSAQMLIQQRVGRASRCRGRQPQAQSDVSLDGVLKLQISDRLPGFDDRARWCRCGAGECRHRAPRRIACRQHFRRRCRLQADGAQHQRRLGRPTAPRRAASAIVADITADETPTQPFRNGAALDAASRRTERLTRTSERFQRDATWSLAGCGRSLKVSLGDHAQRAQRSREQLGQVVAAHVLDDLAAALDRRPIGLAPSAFRLASLAARRRRGAAVHRVRRRRVPPSCRPLEAGLIERQRLTIRRPDARCSADRAACPACTVIVKSSGS